MLSTVRFGLLLRYIRPLCRIVATTKFEHIKGNLTAVSSTLLHKEINGISIMPPKKKGTTKVDSTTPKKEVTAKSKKAKEPLSEDDLSENEANGEIVNSPAAKKKTPKAKKVKEPVPEDDFIGDEENGEEAVKIPVAKKRAPKAKKVKEPAPEEDLSANEENGEEVVKTPTAAKKKAPRGKKVKAPTSEPLSEDDDLSEENCEEAALTPITKKKTAKKTPAKTKKQKETKKAKEENEEDEGSEENNVAKKKPQKKTKGKSAKSKAKDENESNDEAIEENKAEAKTPKNARGSKKRARDDDSEDEPKEKKSKTESKQPMNQTESNLDEIDFTCDKVNEDREKFNLKISCWNVSGIRALIKKKGLDYIKKEDADIIALQEIKCETDKLPNEVKLPGYEQYYLDSDKSGYCGVALYSKVTPIGIKYGIENSNCNNEGRIITAEYEKFYLVNTYVPNAGRKLVTMPKRLEWNKNFKKYIKELDVKKPVIICGDMNVAHQEIDLKNPKTNTKNAGFTKEERDGMTDFLAQGFVDTFRKLYPEKTDAYTFWSYMGNARAKNVGWRLDYYLVSERVSKKVCDNVIRDRIFGSDHCPIVLYITM